MKKSINLYLDFDIIKTLQDQDINISKLVNDFLQNTSLYYKDLSSLLSEKERALKLIRELENELENMRKKITFQKSKINHINTEIIKIEDKEKNLGSVDYEKSIEDLTRIIKEKDLTLIMCPIKKVNIYKWACIEKCTYYEKCEKGGLG